MANDLNTRVKTGLNETRLLILGGQVLLGFQYQAFFQDGFSGLPAASQYVCLAGLAFVLAAVALLVIPSMQHRLIEEGRATGRLVRATSFYTGLGLAPLAASLAAAAYVVIARHFGNLAGILAGGGLGGIAAFAWFGFAFLIGRTTENNEMGVSRTPLATKIEQLLTEARVIIPGAQALFGFQFVAMLTNGFDRLPQSSKNMHALALGLIALNVVLLMTPAALHRLSFGGEDSPRFLRIGSALVIAAPLFLAAGIAVENYVVLQKVMNAQVWSVCGAVSTFVLLAGCWYALPLALRNSAKSRSARRRRSDTLGMARQG
jgi:hypothetical protein